MKERPTFTGEQLLHLKGEIETRWEQLPPEHQASMALVLLSKVLEGEYGEWLRSAIDVLSEKQGSAPVKVLPIMPLSGEHLALASLTEEEIGQLDENDLKSITYGIARHFTNDVFWEELEYLAREVTKQKREG